MEQQEKTTDLKKENIISALCYFPGVFIIGPLLKPDSTFCMHHAKQGLVLSIAFLFIIIFSILAPLLIGLIFLLYFALSVIAAYRAYRSEKWSIPIVQSISNLFKIENLFKTATNTEQNAVNSDNTNETDSNNQENN